jgi:hypothetical protein
VRVTAPVCPRADASSWLPHPGPNELKILITIGLDKTVLDLKKAIAERSDVEAERQRLIYSGKVLKVRASDSNH